MTQPAEVTPGMLRAFERAQQITGQQIETALQLNAKYFNGAGLDHVGEILQALATNYHATVMYTKPMK